jgi:hypothetical protein
MSPRIASRGCLDRGRRSEDGRSAREKFRVRRGSASILAAMTPIRIAQIAFPPTFMLAALLRWLLRPADRGRSEQLLWLALGVFMGQWAGGLALMQLTRWNLPTYDEYIYRLDGLLGFQPSFALGRILIPQTRVMYVLDVVYECLLLYATIVIALHIWRGLERTREVVYAFILNFLLAPFLYALLPVCGPGYAFNGLYPFVQPVFVAQRMHIHAPPNGIPSVHLSTALLALWFSRGMPVGRWVAWLYLVCTILATLGSGEHYLFDLACAVPYSFLVVLTARYLYGVWLNRGYVNFAGARSTAADEGI